MITKKKRTSRNEANLVKITVWAPIKCRDRLKAFAKKLHGDAIAKAWRSLNPDNRCKP